jgi:hypothetical protein
MKKKRTMLRAATLALLLSACALAACSDNDDCAKSNSCTGAVGASGQGGEGGGGGNGGDGGQGGGPPVECIPSEAMGIVDDSCGVFVSSHIGIASNPGTKEQSFASIGAALAAAGSKPVYLGGEAFDEAVDMQAGTDVYGALARRVTGRATETLGERRSDA